MNSFATAKILTDHQSSFNNNDLYDLWLEDTSFKHSGQGLKLIL